MIKFVPFAGCPSSFNGEGQESSKGRSGLFEYLKLVEKRVCVRQYKEEPDSIDGLVPSCPESLRQVSKFN